MNKLTVITRPGEGNQFQVYWMTGLVKKGIVNVSVPDSWRDRDIVAELAALQFLLEEKCVVGHDRCGNKLFINVSFGAIKKLVRRDSDKVHLTRHSIFLTTRFAGATLVVKKADDWLEGCESVQDTVDASQPVPEKINLYGVGEVEVTGHAIDAFFERRGLLDKGDAWRRLRNMAQDDSIMPFQKHKNALDKARHRQVGELYWHPHTEWMFVITRQMGKVKLVTMYRQFRAKKSA